MSATPIAEHDEQNEQQGAASIPAYDAQSEVLLDMSHITKSFPGVQALKGVSLSVRAGEVRALLGENGAGKSTLMNILDGVFSEYGGSIRVAGQPVTIHSPREAQALGIAMIHQELHLVPELSIADNIFLGRELRTRWGTLDRPRMNALVKELLAELDLHLSPTQPVRLARVAEQQLIEVAKALSLNARILIMDEPTSALADAETQRLFTVIRQLSARGVAILYISHRLEELPQIAHTVTVMRDGELIGTHPLAGVSRADLIAMMVGRPLQEFFSEEQSDESVTPLEALRVEKLTLPSDPARLRRPLHDISFSVRSGEIVGLAGLLGAGRTETLETIFGVHPDYLGHIKVEGRTLRMRSPRQAIRRGIGFITEDRKGQSLITQLSVRFNISISALDRFAPWMLINQRREHAAVSDAIRDFHVKTAGPAVIVDTLSGGNQQKVALAKSLLTHPHILLMDEPTRGIDVGAKSEIYALMRQLTKAGMSILMASSELPELLAMCDRILVLCEGRLTGEFRRGEATQDMLLEAATTHLDSESPPNGVEQRSQLTHQSR